MVTQSSGHGVWQPRVLEVSDTDLEIADNFGMETLYNPFDPLLLNAYVGSIRKMEEHIVNLKRGKRQQWSLSRCLKRMVTSPMIIVRAFEAVDESLASMIPQSNEVGLLHRWRERVSRQGGTERQVVPDSDAVLLSTNYIRAVAH